MLLFYDQFMLRYAIRNHLFLINPRVNMQDDVFLPKDSVLHYLDLSNDIIFPTRALHYIKNIPNNKKIPIQHLTDLVIKEGTSSLLNKLLPQDIRKWNVKNIKEFRGVDLIEAPNKDVNLISMINYNTVKELYKYSTSLLAAHNKYTNLMTTYYSYVKKAVNASKSKQFIRIELPGLLPSYFIIDKLLAFNPVKFSRLIKDVNLRQVIDIYSWLSKSTRDKSSLRDITDEESESIIIEFSYKGYSAYLPLSLLRSLSEESKLVSKTKLAPTKLNRLYVMFMLKVQNNINKIIEGIEVDLEDIVDEPLSSEIDDDIDDDDIVPIEKLEQDETINNFIAKDVARSAKLNKKDIPDTKNDTSNVKIESSSVAIPKKFKDIDINAITDFKDIDEMFSNVVDTSIEETNNAEADDIYLDLVSEKDDEGDVAVQTSLTIDFGEEFTNELLNEKTVEEKFNLHVAELVSIKSIGSAEIRALKKQFSTRLELKSPYDETKHLDIHKTVVKEDLEFTKEDKALTINNELVSDDMKSEHLRSFDDKYVKNVLRKDIIACVSNLEKANIIIKDYVVEQKSDALGNYEIHKLSISPLNGKPSTVYFKLPVVDSEGEMVVSGIKIKMRKQKSAIPIMKINDHKVAITSNYNKLFISRTERKAFDRYDFIVNYIKKDYLLGDGVITGLIPGNNFSNLRKLPNMYSYLSKFFLSFDTKEYKLLFNYDKIDAYIDEPTMANLKNKNLVFIGYNSSKEVIGIDDSDELFILREKEIVSIGDIEGIIDVDRAKVPNAFSTIKILGKDIPLGVVMAYYIGLSGLLSVTTTERTFDQIKQLDASKRYTPEKDEVVLKFKDFKLVFNTKNKESSLLLSGFLFFKDFIKKFDIKDFDNRSIYLLLLEERNFGIIHLKELDLLRDIFLDPITISVLQEINEPTEYLKLLLRANQMLTDFSHPDINDSRFTRIRGYDRIPGLMYKVLAESVRAHKFKPNSKGKIELDPYKVWNTIVQDNTVKITEDINPIADIKEMEAVTLVGLDGLNKEAIPAMLRKYSKHDMGLMSEATVDSSDVAVNTYLTPYSKLKNLRGTMDLEDTAVKTNPSKLFSTSVLLAPMAEYDDQHGPINQ